jgi:ABC-type uncharacterized transport system YnjBCD ATPase subunit
MFSTLRRLSSVHTRKARARRKQATPDLDRLDIEAISEQESDTGTSGFVRCRVPLFRVISLVTTHLY